MTHLLAVESRNPLAMAHTFDEAHCVHANMWDCFSVAHISNAAENIQYPGFIWGDFIGLQIPYAGDGFRADPPYRHNILKRGPQPASCLCIGPAGTMPTRATTFRWPI